MTRKNFLAYTGLAAIILIMSGIVSWISSNMASNKECIVYVSTGNPSNLIISSNCKVITTNTVNENQKEILNVN